MSVLDDCDFEMKRRDFAVLEEVVAALEIEVEDSLVQGGQNSLEVVAHMVQENLVRVQSSQAEADHSHGRIVVEGMGDSPVEGMREDREILCDLVVLIEEVVLVRNSIVLQRQLRTIKAVFVQNVREAQSEGRQRKYPHGFAHSEQVCD